MASPTVEPPNGARSTRGPSFPDHENPLAYLEDADVQAYAEQLAAKHDDLAPDLIVRGAFLVKYGNAYENVPELKDREREAMRVDERNCLRSQKKALYLTILLNSIAATVQGWDQTGTNGANLLWPRKFQIPIDVCNRCQEDTFEDIDCQRNLWQVGFVNSMPYVAIAVLGFWLSDPINHFVGRRWTIFYAAMFSIAAPIGSAFTSRWWELAVCRALLGIGMGLKEVTVPIFSAEIAPRQIRGALVMSWQLCTAAGIFLGSVANVAFLEVVDPDYIWRWQLGSALFPAVPLIIGVLFCPESPRWLIKKGRVFDAYCSLRRLRKHRIQAARDLCYIHASISTNEQRQYRKWDTFRRFRDLFGDKRIRRSTVAASVVMAAQQLCGINILAFFSSNIFASTLGRHNAKAALCDNGQYTKASYFPDRLDEDIKKEDRIALLLTLGFATCNALFAVPAIFTIDRWGRRPLLLVTIPLMSLCLFIAAMCSFIDKDHARTIDKDHSRTIDKDHARTITVAVFLYIFAAFYSPGLGPIPFTYSAEVFPITHREIGMGWAVAVNNFFGSILALTFLNLSQKATAPGALGVFAAFNVVALLLIVCFVPETTLMSLEDLDHLFGREEFTRRLIEHHVFEMPLWRYQRAVYPARELGERPQFPS